jgi:hypothetical protein
LTHAADAEKAPIGGAAMALVRLLIALAVAATAYVLIAPRVPALRGWYAANACPYLDRIRTGLCAQTLAGRDMPRRGESARDAGPAGPAEGAAERPNSIASELAQLRQAQQEQGKSLASLAEAQRRNDEREAEEQQRLAAMRQEIQGLQQALAGLKQEIGELRAARPPTPARPAPRAAAPPR